MPRASRSPSYYEFPYVKFHGRSYPLIPITLRNKEHTVNTFALLDSGASVSVFRPEIVKALHLSHKEAEQARMGTPVGGVDIHLFKVEIGVRDTVFKTTIGFSKKYTASFNILGRAGFFHRFSVCFNEIMKTVVMVPLNRLSS